MSTMAMAMPVMTDLVTFMPSIHPQRAFRRGIEELMHELVVGLLGLTLGAEEPHLSLVEDADVVRKTAHRADVVADHHRRRLVLLADLANQGAGQRRAHRVETRVRLVE